MVSELTQSGETEWPSSHELIWHKTRNIFFKISFFPEIIIPAYLLNHLILNHKHRQQLSLNTYLTAVTSTVLTLAACVCPRSLQSCLTLCNFMAPLSMGFSRQEYWSGLPCPPPGDLPTLRIKPESLMFPASTGGFFTTSTACTLY